MTKNQLLFLLSFLLETVPQGLQAKEKPVDPPHAYSWGTLWTGVCGANQDAQSGDGDTTKVTVSQDTYVRGVGTAGSSNDYSNINYNSTLSNKVALVAKTVTDITANSASFRQSWLRFDLSGVSTTAGYNKVILRLTIATPPQTGNSTSFVVQPVSNDTWLETTLTFANRPASSVGAIIATVPFDADANPTAAYVDWDITNYALQELAGDKLLSLAILNTTTAGGSIVTFNSKEAGEQAGALPNIAPVLFFTQAETTTPVELTSFKGAYDDEKVDLDWTTKSESNTDYFEVQRSTDSKIFVPAGRVSANGTSLSTHNYQYVDDVNGIAKDIDKLYYRLSTTDLDGSNKLSDVIVVTRKKQQVTTDQVRIAPNPVASLLKINSSYADNFSLFNAQGIIVSQFYVAANSWKEINVSGLPSGIYYLKALHHTNKSYKILVVK